jgi:hypothetical protein
VTRLRLSLLLLLSLVASFAGAEAFVIEKFISNMSLSQDGDLIVEESIQVRFTEKRRGIFRAIPESFRNGRGSVRRTQITFLSARNEKGAQHQTSLSTSNGVLNIRIGNPNVFLPAGARVTYVIRYKVDNAINWFNDADWEPSAELFWNVNGTEWQTTTDYLEANLTFPKVESGKYRARIFFGRMGDPTNQTASQDVKGAWNPRTKTSLTLENGSLKVVRKTRLQPGENLSLVLNVPQSVVPQPTFQEAATEMASSNLGFLLPLPVAGVLFLFWLLIGRDAKTGPVAVRFDPPDDLSGPEAGAFIDEHIDQRDISAGIVSLAVKRYVRIHPVPGGFFSRPTAEVEVLNEYPNEDLTVFEQSLLRLLALHGPWLHDTDLRQSIAPNLYLLKQSLIDSLMSRGYYRISPQTTRGATFVLGLFLIAGFAYIASKMSPVFAPFPILVGAAFSVPVAYWASKAMPRRTQNGNIAHRDLLGFAEFLKRARTPEIDFMSRVTPDQALFEKYLPHAVALGLTSEWSKAFDGLFTQPPDWYAWSRRRPRLPLD